MSIEVKQLTINSTLQREEDKKETSGKEDEKDGAEKSSKNKISSTSPCSDPDAMKAEVLLACKKLIRQAMNEKRAR